MSGTPYTPEEMTYIQGRNVCYSAIDKIHAEMWGLRLRIYQRRLAENMARELSWEETPSRKVI